LFGVGVRYFSLSTGNDFRGDVIGISASIHPFAGTLFVPYARLGPVYLAAIQGRLQLNDNADARGWGVEGAIGGDFVLPHFAGGPEIRAGQVTQSWVMIGLHVEVRL
jgi:hypothetical protein